MKELRGGGPVDRGRDKDLVDKEYCSPPWQLKTKRGIAVNNSRMIRVN